MLLDEVEALYAPLDHAVFQLVPHTFHECADNLYTAIGQPEIMTKTFWDIYLDLLEQLHNGHDEELTDILSRHQPSMQPDQVDMDLLLNMAPFHLGHPINVGVKVNYISGLDISTPFSSVSVLHLEYADFTSDGNSDMDDSLT